VWRNLGDLNVKSWMGSKKFLDEATSVRMLSVSISGLSAGTYNQVYFPDSHILSRINIAIDAEKSSFHVSLRSRVSDVEVIAKYSSYLLLLRVVRENVCRKIDKEKWDNLEVAWEAELMQTGNPESDNLGFSKEIEYSSSARIVRYGKTSNEKALVSISIELHFRCDMISIMLHRDDDRARKEGTGYDMIVLCGWGLDAVYVKKEEVGNCITASIGKVYVFDLCGNERSCNVSSSVPASFAVLVEGYSAGNATERSDAQLVIKINRPMSPLSATNVDIVVNFLSVTMLAKPMEDVSAFLRCTWALGGQDSTQANEAKKLACNEEGHAETNGTETHIPAKTRKTCLAVKLVLHYPRLIFSADETEKHSRALVLEG
jgi:hypothetical protein